MRMLSHPAVIPLLILLIVIVFGSARLPEIARNMGKALKIVKSEVKELRTDDAGATSASAAPAAPVAPAADAATPVADQPPAAAAASPEENDSPKA